MLLSMAGFDWKKSKAHWLLISKFLHPQNIEDFNKAISLKPDYADAYNNRGFIHLKLGRHQQAFDDYSYVIQLQPIYANAWNNRAFVYLYIRGNIDLGCKEAQIACEQGVCDTLEKAKGQGYCR